MPSTIYSFWQEVVAASDDVGHPKPLATIEPGFDRDIFLFWAEAGEVFEFEAKASNGSGLDAELFVQEEAEGSCGNAGCLHSWYNDNCHGGTLDACLSFAVSRTGYYRVSVASAGAQTSGGYVLSYRKQEDHASSATVKSQGVTGLALDGSSVIGLASTGLFDWFKLTAPTESGGEISVSTCPDSGVDVRLNIYREDLSSGQLVYVGAHDGGDCSQGGDVVNFAYVPGTNYFARVGTLSAGWYSISASVEDASRDLSSSIEDSFDCFHPYGGSITSDLQTMQEGRDEDWYFLDLQKGDFVVVETHSLASGLETRLQIYDEGDMAFARIADSAGVVWSHRWIESDLQSAIWPGGSRLAFSAPRAARYHILVQGVGDVYTGRYSLQCYRPRRWNTDFISDGPAPVWP